MQPSTMHKSHYHNPQSEIEKFIPRKPKRINEISQRFAQQEQKNANHGHLPHQRKKIGPIDLSNLDSSRNPAVNSPRSNVGGGPTGGADSTFLSKFGFNAKGGR